MAEVKLTKIRKLEEVEDGNGGEMGTGASISERGLDRKEIRLPEHFPTSTTKELNNSKLYLVSSVCFLSNLSMGCVLGYSAILLPQLREERDVDNAETSLIASVSNLGQLVAVLISGQLGDLLGRRGTIAAFAMVTAAGFLTAAFSSGNASALVASRALQGFAIVCSVVQVYISELSPPEQRGYLGAVGTCAISAGITLVYSLGAALHWSRVALACAQLPLICAASFAFFCPESPSWLFLHGRQDQARKTIVWLRGPKYDPAQEMKKLEDLAQTRSAQRGGSSALRELARAPVLRACALLVFLMVSMMASGATVVGFFAVEILGDLGVLGGDAYTAAVLTSLFRLAGAAASPLLLGRGRVGKKTILAVTSAVMGVSILCLSGTGLYQDKLSSALGTFWSSTAIPVSCLVAYFVCFGLGPAAIPWTLLGELVPPKVAPLVGSISVSSALLSLYALTQSYPYMLDALTLEGTFCLYAAVSFAMSIVSVVFLPETNGRESRDVLKEFE